MALASRFQRLAALRKAPVLRLWLKKTWIAWGTGGAYSVFAHEIFPRVARPVLRLWYPPVRGRGMTWFKNVLNSTWQENPRIDEILASVTPVVWLAGFALFMALLEARVRPAVEAARARGRALEKEGLAKLDAGREGESVILLREALRHSVDAGDERRIAERIGKLAPSSASVATRAIPA